MTQHRHYLQSPSLHQNHLAFIAEDDLWLCDLSTLATWRLTTDFGTVRRPHFSPCGQWIAFSSDRDGACEAYVIAREGGQPCKLTYTGNVCLVVGWQDADHVLISSTFDRPFREGALYRVHRSGGDLIDISVGPANSISYGKVSGSVVIQRHGYGYPSWKRYQGGTCAELWIKTSATTPFSLFCKQNANMIQPVWHAERIFFISDFQGHGNVYSAKSDGSDLRRHTHCEGFYVRSFTIHEQTLIYAQAGQLYSTSVETRTKTQASHLAIRLSSAEPHNARRYDFSTKGIEAVACNHNASMVSFCHRGRLFFMPSYQGPAILAHTETQRRYRHCTWLAKTPRVLAVCDDGDCDYPVLFDTSQTDSTPTSWPKVHLGRVLTLSPAPTGDWVAVANHKHELMLFNHKTGKLKTISHSRFSTITQVDWSSDGQWLCYAKQNSHETSQIILYNITEDTHSTVTSGHYHDHAPCFDPEGKYLYFLSERSLTPSADALCFQYNFQKTTKAYACCLQQDAERPFYHQQKAVESETEDTTDTKENKEDEKAKKEKNIPTAVEISLTDIEQRIVPFPVDAGQTTKLLALPGKVLFLTSSSAECAHDASISAEQAGSLEVYDLKELKFDHLFDGISGAELSFDRNFLYYSNHRKQVRIIPAGSKPDSKDESYRRGGLLNFARARAPIDPQSEWQFMIQEAWRLQKDFFWDQEMGEVAWTQVLKNYMNVAKRISTRAELNDLIAELHGELGSSHAYVIGGDLPDKRDYQQGLLGARTSYDAKAGAYRIDRLIDSQDHSSDALLNPCRVPGVQLAEGDLIYAVNGIPLGQNHSVDQALEQQAGQYVHLQIKRSSSTNTSTESVIVKTSHCNHERLYREWVEKNRAYVTKHSQGKLGYIHIPDMSKDGYAEFMRSFLQAFDCEGLVIDVRFNGGGHVSSLILQKLALKRFGLDNARWHDANLCYPANSPRGCMVGLCNEYAGSDGDMFSYAFKKMRLGRLIGKRTWGGVIGINVRHQLIDGGVTTQPEYAIWLDGVGYGVENHGVDPDEVVEITPEQAATGQDPQLDRAIMIALEELQNHQYPDLDDLLAKTKKPSKKAPKLPKEITVSPVA